jgi:PIN domain nuclease of toxin-antitoxin system
MTLLLDTHTLLWCIGKSDELSSTVRAAIENPSNEVLVSAVSLWEIALKHSVGKLSFEGINLQDIPKYCKRMGFDLIALEPEESIGALALPPKNQHKDPFDRMLIYQCIYNDYVFVSRDSKMALYVVDGLKYIW